MSDADDGATEQVSQEVAPDFRALLEKLSARHDFDFREYKEASLARRIRARMSQVHVDSFAAYARFLDANPDEHVALFNTILINITNFFRDPEAWNALAEDVIPRLVGEAAQSRSLRIWSAGCSSGEEPYSIAMLLPSTSVTPPKTIRSRSTAPTSMRTPSPPRVRPCTGRSSSRTCPTG